MIYGAGPKGVMPSSVQKISPNSVSGWIGILNQIKGPNFTISTACSSGANAIGLGKVLIESGFLDSCIVGGVEAPITKATIAAYESMMLILDNHNDLAPCPFDKSRRGMVLSEGAACL